MNGKLILENGMSFDGKIFGYTKDGVGEVVFNTGMSGYQEVLTDPSYYGQIVTMTYPLVGNYGINFEDVESSSPKVAGFVVREKSDCPSNFRCEIKLETYLKENKIIGIEAIDTRFLTKVIRNSGTMRGIIVKDNADIEYAIRKIKLFDNKDAVSKVTSQEVYKIKGDAEHIAIIDFGIKQSIIKCFTDRKCKLTVFPASTLAKEILDVNPDMIFLSNGPADPKDLKDEIETIKCLIGKKPIGGICLGHQLLALALGGSTAKLKFGHRGCNHPVKDVQEGKVYITSQNHGYYVDNLPKDMIVTHVSLNDQTIEGMEHTKYPIYSVQFHPESNPGPKDIEDKIFDKFLKLAQSGGNI